MPFFFAAEGAAAERLPAAYAVGAMPWPPTTSTDESRNGRARKRAFRMTSPCLGSRIPGPGVRGRTCGRQQLRCLPAPTCSILANLLYVAIRSCTSAGLPPLHSTPPLMLRIVSPKPPLLTIAWCGVILPGPDWVIQYQSASFQVTVEFFAARSG